jgi:DNA-binding NtrC family response regulator
MVTAAMRQAGFELRSEDDLASALSLLDRERFHLVICDTVHDSDAVAQMRSFLEHFALATPVVFLHPRNAMPVLPANDPQFHALRVPATSADLAELARRVISDFSGL